MFGIVKMWEVIVESFVFKLLFTPVCQEFEEEADASAGKRSFTVRQVKHKDDET